jgi:predicted DNA-binding transcriptional regulator AlpA
MASADHPPGHPENPLLTTNEVGKILRCKGETIRVRITKGQFPNRVRAGRFWLVPKSDVDAILNQEYGA